MGKQKSHVAAVLVVFLAALGLLLFGPRLVDQGMRWLYPKPYQELVRREAAEFQLPENLVYAVMRAESGFDQQAKSRAGAHGLMQLTETTFHWIASLHPPENGGENILDPADNVHCGCALLRLLLNHYESLEVALAAYNAGMGNVDGWLQNVDYSSDGKTLDAIPYPETAAYLKRVKETYERYGAVYGEEEQAVP